MTTAVHQERRLLPVFACIDVSKAACPAIREPGRSGSERDFLQTVIKEQ